MTERDSIIQQLVQLLAKRAEIDEQIARGRAILEGMNAAERDAKMAEAKKATEQ